MKFYMHAHLIITIEGFIEAETAEEAGQKVQGEMLKYYPLHRPDIPGHNSRIEIHASPAVDFTMQGKENEPPIKKLRDSY